MKRRSAALAVSSFVAIGLFVSGGTAAFAEQEGSEEVPVFNGGTCEVAPVSTSVSFGEGVKADGDQRTVWNGNGTFAAKTANVGVAIQNFETNAGTNYRPWVGLAAYDGRTIYGAVAEFTVTAGAEEGANWAFETLPVGSAQVNPHYVIDPTTTDELIGSFRVELPTMDDSRRYGHKAGWVVRPSAGSDPLNYARSATLTVSGAKLSQLHGENSNCQPMSWSGVAEAIYGNGEEQSNTITVNVGSGDASRLGGIVTDAEGSVIEAATVTVTEQGEVLVSVLDPEVEFVNVQLTLDGEALGDPFVQPLKPEEADEGEDQGEGEDETPASTTPPTVPEEGSETTAVTDEPTAEEDASRVTAQETQELANTGMNSAWMALGAAALAVVAGAGMLLRRRA